MPICDSVVWTPIFTWGIYVVRTQFRLSELLDKRIWPLSWWQTEETKSSDRFGAYGILTAICISIVVGWGYIVALAYTVIDPSSLLDPGNDAGGYAVAQLFYNVFRDRFGSGAGGIVCLGINAVAIYLGGLTCVTSNSRSVIAFHILEDAIYQY